ncbi:MAG: hypothetical protein MUE77_13395 [Sandarakinorhabdus sp.]|nr:hypothetical protein [Sandarakinorhabdus sp.]
MDDQRTRHLQFAIQDGERRFDAFLLPDRLGGIGDGIDAQLRFGFHLGLGGAFQQDQQQAGTGQQHHEQQQADPRCGGARVNARKQQGETRWFPV